MPEESSGGEEEITTSTNVLVPHDELLSWDRKYFSEEKDLKSIVGASSILKFSERSGESVESKIFKSKEIYRLDDCGNT